MKCSAALEAVKEELDAVGVKYDVDISKHFLVTWFVNGRRRRTSVVRTGSDHRGPMNARHDVRRMLREDGLIEAKGARQ
jgi:hypothetical protein